MTTTATSESKPAATTTQQPGAGFLAAGASFFLPGLGHILAKSAARGVIFFVLWAAALSLSYKFLFSYEHISKFPLTIFATLAIMLIASIDAFFTARKKGLLFGGCVATFAGLCLVVAIGFSIWAITDALFPKVGPARSFMEALGTLSGKYALGIVIVAVALMVLAALGRTNVALGGVVRVGLGLLIAALLFWPHDKMVQKTALQMIADRNIIIINEDSMTPGITAGDWVVVHKDAPVVRFDAVLINVPAEEREEGKPRYLNKIKRVYGMPSEEVEIVGGTLMINRDEMQLPPKTPKLTWSQNPMRLFAVGEAGHAISLRNDEYYVLGDNLDNAYDSRYALPIPDSGHRQPGAIPQNNLGGRASFVIWPLNHFGTVQ